MTIDPPNDPRSPDGPFGILLRQVESCKRARTCPTLDSRPYYFEPNHATIAAWQASGRYLHSIDRRVAFVCESPGPQFNSTDIGPFQCWATTAQDIRFAAARQANGFQDCYVTNSVKCGVRKGSRHSDEELRACRPFLIRELELLRPLVVVGVGENAYRSLRYDVVPQLEVLPTLFQITHYSARLDVSARWAVEFAELHRLLGRLRPAE